MIFFVMLHRFTYFIMRNRLIFLLPFCLLTPFVLSAQVNDAGLWASINLEKKINKKFSVHLGEELRFYENITELGSFFTEASLEYRLNKTFGFSAGYRFSNRKRLDDSYSKRHRYLVNATVKRKFNQINTSLRLRYQSQYADYYSDEDGQVPSNYLRTKLSFKYDLNKKYTPFLSGETFIHTNRADGMLIDNYRIEGGIEYEFSKVSSIQLSYIFNKEVNVNDPWTMYVLGISWSYVLK